MTKRSKRRPPLTTRCNNKVTMVMQSSGKWNIDNQPCTVDHKHQSVAGHSSGGQTFTVFIRELTTLVEWYAVVGVDSLPLNIGIRRPGGNSGAGVYSTVTVLDSTPLLNVSGGYEVIKRATSSTRGDELESLFSQLSLADGVDSTRIEVKVIRTTFRRATIRWTNRTQASPSSWLVTLFSREDGRQQFRETHFFRVASNQTQFKLPVKLTAGASYRVGVRALKDTFKKRFNFCKVTDVSYAEFRAELTPNDLRTLYNRAISWLGNTSSTPCNWLYRNRWKKYFNEILNKKNGIMEVYIKDNSGDQASPINGQIDGLFFMANNVNGLPPPQSAFGSVRLQVPAEVLLQETPNIYFTDFYCMRGKMHYVTLVTTKTGSDADIYCRGRLLSLSLDDNPFLFRSGGRLHTANRRGLYIEVFYTEDIDIHYLVNYCEGKLLGNIPLVAGCKGRSTPGGVPKNALCTFCTL